eukprot:8754520-Heterocapsa_arctica.AAC.1
MVQGNASSHGKKSTILAVRKSSCGLYNRTGSHQRAKVAFPWEKAGFAASTPLWIPPKVSGPWVNDPRLEGMSSPSSLGCLK